MKSHESPYPIHLGGFRTDRVMAGSNFGFQGIYQWRKKTLNLGGNHPVAESTWYQNSSRGPFFVFSHGRRFCRSLGDIIGKKRLVANFQGVPGLPQLPVLDAGLLAKIGKKGLDILRRTVAQSLPWQKINICLRPFDIKKRTVRPDTVILHTGLKGILKLLSRCGLFSDFFRHKIHPFQRFNRKSRPYAIRNYYVH